MRRDRRVWLPMVAGGLTGLALGLAVGYFGRSPVFGTSVFGYVFIPLGITLALVIALATWALARRSSTPRLALAALLVAGAVGMLIAPLPPGAPASGRGSVSIGTDAAATAYYSGPVSCQWMTGGLYVEDIRGFSWKVRDPALFGSLDLGGPVDVENVHLGTGARPIGSEAAVEFGEDQESLHGSFTAFDLVRVAADGTSGTARSKDGAVVIAWTCGSGPRH